MAESGVKLVSNSVNSQCENRTTDQKDEIDEHKTETVMEPMLLEDYAENTVPRSLRNILNYCKQEGITLNKNDITVIFIYMLMLEVGYVTPDFILTATDLTDSFHYKRLLNLTNSLPTNWKISNCVYTLNFVLPTFTLCTCFIICTSVGDDLVINAIVKYRHKVERSFSLLLDPEQYVVNTTGLFQDLRNLSLIIKNNICYPCKAVIMEFTSLRYACLCHLPQEILDKIRKYCTKTTISNFDKSLSYVRS